jgi:sugar O-acyltransferase (sialic acid O-acetyltransferase NeuD family)
MKGLLIFGASSLAKMAYYYATRDMGLNVLGFVVDEQFKVNDTFLSLPVFTWHELDNILKNDKTMMYVAVGYRSMRLRASAYKNAKTKGFELVNIIARSSFVADDVIMGDNNFVMPGAVIEPGVKIGSNNVAWSNATICHDSIIGDHNFFASNVTVGGEVSMGNCNFLGFSSVIVQQRKIGNEVLIGALSLLIDDGESLSRYQGSPARRVGCVDSTLGICVS